MVNNQDELWSPIDEFNGAYEVSSKGNIRVQSAGDLVQHLLDKDGYHIVRLMKDGAMYTRRVHRLVALAFIENPDEKPTVNHIDEDKNNNDVSNLEWATYREQVNYGTRNHRAMQTIDSCSVVQLDAEGNVIGVFESVRDAARYLHTRPERVINALKGKYQTACGYRWKYQSEIGGRTGPKEAKGVLQLSLDGDVVARHRSVNAAAKTLGISPAGISECLNGKRRTNCGFVWQVDDHPLGKYNAPTRPVSQLNDHGIFIAQFNSVSDAARSIGKSTGDICRCLKGRRKTCGGYQWKYT